MDGKKVLMLDVDPQGDLTKMLGQRKPHDLPLTLANAMSDVVAGTMPRDHPEIMHHHRYVYDDGLEHDGCSAVQSCRRQVQ